MSDDFTHELPEELIEFEQALSTLAPAPPQLDRDRLMFAAGVARGQATGPLRASRSLGVPTTSDQDAASGPSLVGALSDQDAASGLVAKADSAALRADSPRLWGTARGWRLSAAAAALVAGVFASLYVVERNRPQVVIREVVTVQPSEPPAGGSMASTEEAKPQAPDSALGTPYSVPSTQYSVLRTPFWLFASHQPLATNHPSNYLALRQVVLTRGLDALPQPAYTGDPRPLTPPRTARDLLNEFLPKDREASTKATDSAPPDYTKYDIGEMT